jgi:hypothetical protein
MRLHPGTFLLFGALFVAPLLLTGCDRDGPRLSPDTVARAGDFSLQVETAAQLLAPIDELPSDPEVVSALADFWVDYHLLALAVNREGELDRIDLGPVFRQQESQELVMRLRDEVIDDGEPPSDAEVEAFYHEERPGERVRARHILLLFPEGATQEQRDSVQALAVELRDRARAGADFATLAEEWSEDPGSAARGGDLNFFPRGSMVPAFEEAAFALEPGEVSDVVETQFGLHVIRVEEREFPEVDEVREQLRSQLQMQRTSQAESIFVAGIEEPANVELTDEALDRARELAADAETRLTSREANQPLARYQGGAYTAREYREFLMNQPEQLRQQIEMASDDQLEGLLRNLTRGELLVEEARSRGISLSSDEEEEIRSEIREQYRSMAGLLGLADITPQEGETLDQAVEQRVEEVMRRIVRGEQDVFPLGSLTLPLRDHFGAALNPAAMERVADRITALRGEGPVGGGAKAGGVPPELVPDEPPPSEEGDGEG